MLPRKQSLRNPLAYPAGVAPSFDPNHVAARALTLSSVASGANFLNLLTGVIGTRSGAGVTGAINGGIGPSTLTAANTDYVQFTGMPAIASGSITCAAIFQMSSLATGGILCTNSADTSWGFYYSATLVSLSFRTNGAAPFTPSPTLVPTANQPHFAIFTSRSSGSAMLLLNLATGKITISTGVSGGTPGASNGTYTLGNLSTTTARFPGGIAAVMFGTKSLSLPEMFQWAQDPWAFWYPHTFDLTQIMSPAVAAGGSFLAAWANNSNLPVLGTGTY